MPTLAPSDTMTAFIEQVKEVMERDHIMVKDLAERCDMARPSLSRLLAGKSGSATTATLDRIADALGMRVGITLEKK